MSMSRSILVRFNLLMCSLSLALTDATALFADDAASRAVVEKAIEKNGGEKLLAKFKGTTSKIKGTVHVNGAPLTFTGDIVAQGMDQQRIAISFVFDGQSISFARVLNHNQGWRKLNDSNLDMTPEELAETKEAAYSGWVTSLLPLKDKAFQLAPFGEIEIAGRKVTGVNVTREGHRSVNLFFDNETFQLVRSETVVRDEASAKEMTEESNYSDFKPVEGILYPRKIVTKRNGEPHAEIDVEDIQLSESFDDSTFAKP